MFCINCGTQLDDSALFCPYCGKNLSDCHEFQSTAADPAPTQYQYTPPQPVQPVQPPQYQPVAYQPVPSFTGDPYPGRKKRRKGLLLGLTAGIVLLLAAAVVLMFVSGVFAGPNIKLGNAITKSVDAYVQAAKKLPDCDFSGLKESKGYSADLTAKLHELNLDPSYNEMLSMLEGASVTITHDLSLEERDLSLSLSPSLGSAKLLTAEAAIRDHHVYLACPELLGDTVYGADTETIGADLQKFGVAGEDLEYIGFNFFDIIEKMKPLMDELKFTEEETDEITAAVLTMFAEAEVEKIGKEEIDVNGTDIECTEYAVLIPEDTLDEVFDLVKDMMRDTDYADLAEEMMETLLSSICSLEENVAYAMEGIDFSELDTTDDAFDAVRDILKELEDLEFSFYVADGYVMSVYWEDTIYDVDFEITADFGGNGEYVDTLGLELNIDDEFTVVLESTGDHAARDGNYTDETSIEIDDGYESIDLRFETEYNPESGDLTFNVRAADILDVSVEGIFTGGENSLELTLDKVNVAVFEEELVTFGLSFSIGTYEKRVSMSNPVLISTLTEDDLWEIADEIEAQAYGWIMDLVAEYPELLSYVF